MELKLLLPLATPLFAAAIIVLFFRTSRKMPAFLSVASALFAFALALSVMLSDVSSFNSSFELFKLGNFTLDLGILFDPLAANMLFVVCFVGLLIHIFSVGYMDDAESRGRFFAGMSFFMFSMTGLVLSSNLFMMFVFWELVGFSSYALIGQYSSTEAAKEASKKAFIVNRVGDFGFLLGIIYCWSFFGTTNFSELAQIIAADPSKASTGMGMLLLCGFLGKSAQFPLQVWLPDAMAGPTPVSALIHAATMVAAGVFMMVRLCSFGFLTPAVLDTVLVLCSLMALCAGLWALGQTDIKKILAYSTLAHLGLMGAGVALGYDLAMYHLTTHAFFKATLFLVAGSIIHACHHEQDIYKMGGIFSRMPITSIVALLATFSIIAIPYFSGYYSKEAIVVAAYTRSAGGAFIYQAAFWIIFAAAALTPIYMFRLFFNVFCGTPHSECAANARESSLWMTFPLVVLAVYSVFGAWGVAYESQWLDGKFSFIMPTAAVKFVSGLLPLHSPTPEIEGTVGLVENAALACTFIGIGIAYVLYGRNRGYDPVQRRAPYLYNALEKHGWFDCVYNWYVAKVQQRIATFLATFADLLFIEMLCVRGSGVICSVVGYGIKKLHVCSCNSQVKWMVFGAILLFVLIFA